MKSLSGTIRLVWLGLWATLATMILFFPVLIAVLASRTVNLAFSLSKVWAHIMLAVSFVPTEIKNREKIQTGISYVIISNHQALYDIIALVTTLGIQFRWFIKKEILKIPLFGYALYASRNIFIDRSHRIKRSRALTKASTGCPKA